jgi:mono/diheme cytochrome c family protein
VTVSLRFIMMSMILCCVVSCSQSDVPQAIAQLVSQATSVDGESTGEPSSLVESYDESPQFTSNDSSLAIFEKRILPIFQSAKPSSCAECHLSGVDLKQYIRPTQQQTFASLVSAGLIDVAKPDESKILTFISRRPEKTSLVTDEIRQVEFEAFRTWVRAAVSDSTLIADKDVQPIGPQLSEEIIRHARKDRVLASFVENVWTEVGRCAACHSPDQNQKQVKEHGEQVSWITLRDPQATLNYMLEADLIDTDEPEKSLLLMKPTMQIKHGGGQKMVIGDRSYMQFRRFIDDYKAIVQGKYATSEQLPEQSNEVSVVTDIWFKIEGVPAKYDKMLLQVDLYQQTDSGWSEHRVATSDRPVFGGGNLWQHSLSLTAQRGTDWATQIAAVKLPSGKYLVKLYIDQTGKLQKDFTAELNEQDLVGEVELESQWPAGYGNMTIVKFPAE